MDRGGASYQTLVRRAKWKGKKLNFFVDEFRAWIVEQLGGRADGCRKCAYCNTMLNVQTFVVDHDIPIAAPWHGSMDLSNLVMSCARCNGQKGKMSGRGFLMLIEFAVLNLDPRDMTDMTTRLSAGGEGQKQMWARNNARRAAAKTTVSQEPF